MAQTKEPKNFEEYYFQEFLETKQENNTLKNLVLETQGCCRDYEKKYQELLDLVKQALANSRVEDDIYCNIYINGNFVGLFDKEDNRDLRNNLVALAKLIERINSIPEREE